MVALGGDIFGWLILINLKDLQLCYLSMEHLRVGLFKFFESYPYSDC